jgi:hypothetical protein
MRERNANPRPPGQEAEIGEPLAKARAHSSQTHLETRIRNRVRDDYRGCPHRSTDRQPEPSRVMGRVLRSDARVTKRFLPLEC